MIQLIHNSNDRGRSSMFGVPTSGRRPPSWRSRSAFTLIELLIVIAIIGVLTAMSLSLLAGASNDAKISATQARMSQITAILQLQMEDYEVRRFPIANRILDQFVADNPINGMNARLQLKYLRRQLLMALIDSEMPRPVRTLDGGGSLVLPIGYIENEAAGQLGSAFNLTVPSTFAGGGDKHVGVFGGGEATFSQWLVGSYGNDVDLGGSLGTLSLSTILNRVTSSGAVKFQRQVDAGVDLDANDVPIELDLPGEYLHEILRSIQIDGQAAVESLGNSAIGDTDDDGIPEVVDAWGEPLLFDLEQVSATVDGDNTVRANGNGVVPLDPRYPMALGDLQIVVGSNRIPESLPVIERISRGVE